VRPFGKVVYLMPPFVISTDQLSTLTAAIHAVLAERSGQH
jgi:adenosylmethionine-8-amino-7-oxononanoate aminotransferase